MVMDVNKTHYSDHFAINTNTASLCCLPETSMSIVSKFKNLEHLIQLTKLN